ncbi:MAG: signal recognition particle protein [Polyangiaceae bacterium]|nr:signal recognition particle protein [Polyangiaceae bacterium]
MFDALSNGFREARNRLAGLTSLDEKNIQAALKEVRRSLLEADVELGVVKRFLARVEETALGSTVQTRIKHGGETLRVSAAEQFIKICHDELVLAMRGETENPSLEFAAQGPTGIMMVGLQGSGKTTSSAKLARKLKKDGKKVLLVAADMQRPAAVEQLKVLGEQIEIPVFNLPGESPVTICSEAQKKAASEKFDVIIYDTAGRLAIDDALMAELAAIRAQVSPQNILLVIDAMIGQDSVKTARGFNAELDLSGVILTKLDGDARGGAALNVLEITGAPVLFVGMGETTDRLETFRPDGMAGRILGQGDVVGLIEDFEGVIDQKKAEEDAKRMMKGEFTLDDFLNQIRMIQQMGPLKDVIGKMPGMGNMLPPGAMDQVDEGEFGKIEAVIQSMTRQEKNDPNALIREPGRVARIAKGSGHEESTVNDLVQKFLFMQQMMTSMGGSGGGGLAGMMNNIPGMKQLGMARNMRRAMKSGKMPPGMPDLSAMMGGGTPQGASTPKMKTMTKGQKNARKNQRKAQRAARKKK